MNFADILDALENRHARALWRFLKERAGFGHDEKVRYADDRRYGRMWDGFECPPDLTSPRDGTLVLRGSPRFPPLARSRCCGWAALRHFHGATWRPGAL